MKHPGLGLDSTRDPPPLMPRASPLVRFRAPRRPASPPLDGDEVDVAVHGVPWGDRLPKRYLSQLLQQGEHIAVAVNVAVDVAADVEEYLIAAATSLWGPSRTDHAS